MKIVASGISTPGEPIASSQLIDRLRPAMSAEAYQLVVNLGTRLRYSVVEDYPDFLVGRVGRVLIRSTTELAAEAIQQCVARCDVRWDSVGMVIAVTNTGDWRQPCLSFDLFGHLSGRLSTDALTVNLENMGCSVFLKALALAQSYLACNPSAHVLIVSAESHTAYLPTLAGKDFRSFREAERIKDPAEAQAAHNDMQRLLGAFLFGDVGVAMLVAGRDAPGPGIVVDRISHATNLEASDRRVLAFGCGGALDPFSKEDPLYLMGPEVKRRAPQYIHALRSALDADRVGYGAYFLHTGSGRILRAVARQLGFSLASEEMQVTMQVFQDYANTSSCSIPLMCSQALSSGVIGRILALGFGSGFSASGAQMTAVH